MPHVWVKGKKTLMMYCEQHFKCNNKTMQQINDESYNEVDGFAYIYRI